MSEELLSLKWNNHQSHFVDILTFLREQEIFIDVTLACGGKLYPAHKFVLSTCSDYFKQMFTRNPHKHPIVFMKDVSCRDLEALLDFMYNGEVNVPQSSLGSLIKTAEGLQIKGLAVPDDPLLPKKEASLARDRKSSTRDNSYSPSPKRLRVVREKSPPPPVPQFSSSASTPFSNASLKVRSPSSDGGEVGGGEDSRTSDHSSNLNNSSCNTVKPNINNSHYHNDDSTATPGLPDPLNRDPSPGPSGLHKHHSKEEELEIKQEDVVDLGESEETDWRGIEDGGREEGVDEGGGGDTLASESNTANFADVLAPPSDGSLGTSGDPAMGLTPPLPSDFPLLALGGSAVSPSSSTAAAAAVAAAAAAAAAASSSSLSGNVARPHRCSYCGRCFKRKDHRAEHERIHTGERPFVCAVCGRAFIQKHQLVSHARRKHGGGSSVVTGNFLHPWRRRKRRMSATMTATATPTTFCAEDADGGF